MISKELLSSVFLEEIYTDIEIQNAEYDGEEVEWKEVYFNHKRFPLDFVSHKCKEWAHKEGWWVDSNLNFVSIGKLNQSVSWKTFNGYDLKMKEAELIYHSCQWILNNKETSK